MTNHEMATIESHPPERRRRTEVRMCHGSCCCCCCCLHTLGGIIGAGVAPALGANNPMPITYYYDEEDDVAVPLIAKSGLSAVRIFWLLTLVCTVIATMISLAYGNEGLIVGGIIFLLVLPAVQLGCAIVTFFWIALTPRPDRSFQLRQLGRLTLGLFLGALSGILAMVGIGVAMSAR